MSYGVGESGQPMWRRASYCASNECIEVARQDDLIILRNSEEAGGNVLRYTVEEWLAFVRGVKAGEFDDLCWPDAVRNSHGTRASSEARAGSCPESSLDLIDRVLDRATVSWSKVWMHLVLFAPLFFLIAAFFGCLGMAVHAATGMSAWVAAASSFIAAVGPGAAAYIHFRPIKSTKNPLTALSRTARRNSPSSI
jgi:hypothetical protein